MEDVVPSAARGPSNRVSDGFRPQPGLLDEDQVDAARGSPAIHTIAELQAMALAVTAWSSRGDGATGLGYHLGTVGASRVRRAARGQIDRVGAKPLAFGPVCWRRLPDLCRGCRLLRLLGRQIGLVPEGREALLQDGIS